MYLPPAIEFLTRCGLQCRRRWLASSSTVATPDVPTPTKKLDREVLARNLAAIGVQPGGLVMVHSGAVGLAKVGWEPAEFLDFLCDYLGPHGTLAMPTHPVLSEKSGRLAYDVKRSPSSVGMVSELFRRRAGVVRSECPYSAAAAIGPLADELIRDHRRSFAPHDALSPYAKLGELQGQALCVACPLVRLTILHVAEDVCRETLHIPDFYEERVIVVRQAGREEERSIHTRAGWLWWYLALSRWQRDMWRHGFVRAARPEGLSLLAVSAAPVIQWMTDDARRGRSLYPWARLNRWLRLKAPVHEQGTV